MLLPGTELVVDTANIAIQAFGGVWEELLKGSAVHGGKRLYRLVRRRARKSGAPGALAGQLAEFLTRRLEEQGQG